MPEGLPNPGNVYNFAPKFLKMTRIQPRTGRKAKMDFLSSGKSRIRSELPGSNSTAGSARQALGLLVPEDKTGEVAAEEDEERHSLRSPR